VEQNLQCVDTKPRGASVVLSLPVLLFVSCVADLVRL